MAIITGRPRKCYIYYTQVTDKLLNAILFIQPAVVLKQKGQLLFAVSFLRKASGVIPTSFLKNLVKYELSLKLSL